MLYIVSGILGLMLLVALITVLTRKKGGNEEEEEEVKAPPADCCGAHAVCEKEMKRLDTRIEYFNDEELDAYKGIEADSYTDAQISEFRDVLYTLRTEEVEDWLISLEKRGIFLPEILRQEAVEMLA